MKNKIFYGWFMLLGMTFMYAATNGIAMYAFGVLRKMQEEKTPAFGLNPQTQALLPTLLFLTVALVSPFVGGLLDRFDTKKIITVGAFLAVLLTYLHQFMTNYTGLVVIYVFFAIAMSLTGIISFMYLINKWFHKNIGIAAGILLLGSSLGGIIFPKIAASAATWQGSSNTLALVAAVFLLLPLLLIKNSPAEMGLTPDGLPLVSRNTEGPQNTGEGSTLGEALRTPTFYLVLLVTGILWFCINGYIQNHGSFMKDLSKTDVETATIIGLFSSLAIVGKLLFGWLSDKFERNYMMIGSIGLMLISIFILKMSQTDTNLLKPFAVIFGIGFGGTFTMIQVWVADIYAGKNFGSILGVVTMIDTIAGSAGMILLGSMRKASGSFDGGFNLMLGLCAVALVGTFLIKTKR
jgi:MFS transporter, OFA family, oxalate/formate antiporter